ncbi:putative Ig domain-containing protein [Comamonas serinivorans]|nr:putative Ig domain-containing protein [Comamonas serinivorans]
MPGGLSLNPSTGVLSGTPAAGSQGSYTITVTDSHQPTPQTA